MKTITTKDWIDLINENKQLNAQLAKANERADELLARVGEAEARLASAAITGSGAFPSEALNKFAINQQKKGIKDYISTLDRNLPEKVYLSYLAKDALLYCDNLDKKVKIEGQSLYMKLRKEQEQC